MCGISGILSPSKSINLDRLKKMNNLIAHRGPDDSSFFVDDYVALGHRRLSIIDLNTRSNQPMQYKSLNIVFNGEIYNYQDIRQILVDEGYIFDTDGDCEVIIKSYDFWGEKCVEKFSGMWSFAIYDTKKKLIFCSRDRFGIKPFYYKVEDGNLYFGSEIKQLLNNNYEAETDNVIDYIFAGYVDHNEKTFFKDINQLLPSQNMTIEINKNKLDMKISTYFDINDNISERKNIKKLLDKSIKDHLIADVKVGSCLSGGLDSSYINHVISKNISRATAIHCNSSDRKYSEVDKAKTVAKFLDLDLEIVEPSFDEFCNDIDKLFYLQEQPFGDPSIYMQFKVMEKASHLGIKVMLDGQGADEAFMGYSKYLGSRVFEDIINFKWLTAINSIKNAMKNNNLSLRSIFNFILGTRFELIKRFGLVLNTNIKFNYVLSFLRRSDKARTSKSFQYSEIYQYPLQTLLRNEDRNSMHFSIEARVPYLEHKLVSTLYHMPISKKVENGWSKLLLRNAAHESLPEDIIYRKDKLGFNSPPSWLDKISYSEILESKILKKIFSKDMNMKHIEGLNPNLRWRLLSIAIWERVFKIKTLVK